jgi:hypothetical protein
MARKRRTLLTAALAFAATPQGQRLLQQAKEYARRPETKQRAQQLLAQARAKGVRGSSRPGGTVTGPTSPTYGTPPQH